MKEQISRIPDAGIQNLADMANLRKDLPQLRSMADQMYQEGRISKERRDLLFYGTAEAINFRLRVEEHLEDGILQHIFNYGGL